MAARRYSSIQGPSRQAIFSGQEFGIWCRHLCGRCVIRRPKSLSVHPGDADVGFFLSKVLKAHDRRRFGERGRLKAKKPGRRVQSTDNKIKWPEQK